MQFTQFFFALAFSQAALAVALPEVVDRATGCGPVFSYCTGSPCLCFAEGIEGSLNDICVGKGFAKSTGPEEILAEFDRKTVVSWGSFLCTYSSGR